MSKELKKIGTWTGIIGALGVLWAVYSHYNPYETNSNWLHGIWFSSYEYPTSHGSREFEGTTEYFSNGSYNTIGKISEHLSVDSKNVIVEYSLTGVGDWSSTEKSLTVRLTNFRTFPQSILIDKVKLSVPEFESSTGKKFPKFEDSMPMGMSVHYKVLKMSPAAITMELDDPKGNTFSFTMTKHGNQYIYNKG